MKTFAEKIISFNKNVSFNGMLPPDISIMNPFKENKEALIISPLNFIESIITTIINDTSFWVSIPGRFGAGVTGVPFTDTKRLSSECGIEFPGKTTHEPSSAFVYEVINTYGGPEKFYNHIYIQSICPLGFTITNDRGKEVNYNYYDSKELTDCVYDFIIANIKKQISFGVALMFVSYLEQGKMKSFLEK